MLPPHYRIDLKEVPAPLARQEDEMVAVSPDSPLKLRSEVERFALYFKREFSCDFQQFEAREKPKTPYAAYLFLNEPNHYPRYWVGAFCFRWREYTDGKPRWAAQWAWLHPYYRGKGILSRAWGEFHKNHKNFLCEPPLSPAMRTFLKKQGNCVMCWRRLGAKDDLICKKCEGQRKRQEAQLRRKSRR
jgi:hypothetical protein